MDGRARAPAAGTVLNALATGVGSAFAIDEYVSATVTLTEAGIEGEIADRPEADTSLIERAVDRVLKWFEYDGGAHVRTESSVPLASGLKSSSAAANATVLATASALGEPEIDRTAAARIGVEAAREAGVTVTGAFDDATASMLGGLTITDNREDRLRQHERVDWDVAVYVPPEKAFSADADVDRCERIAGVAEVVFELAEAGRYERAMTINGLAFAAALDRPTDPMIEALSAAAGVSLSGTGPSYVAVGDADSMDAVADRWADRNGRTIRTRTQTEGAIVE